MITILNMSIMLSIMIILINHPMSMGLTLLMQVMMIALMTSMMNLNAWFSYILFLIMVGGMLVLFIYMTSIASNEKFKFSNNITSIVIIVMMTMIVTLFTDKFMIENYNYLFESMKISEFQYMFSKYLSFPYNYIMMLLIVYLFVTLIAVVKISKIKYGPLRQLN